MIKHALRSISEDKVHKKFLKTVVYNLELNREMKSFNRFWKEIRR